MQKTLAKIEKFLIYAVVFLIPVVFLPSLTNPYVVAKLTVLTFGVALILLVKSIKTIYEGRLEFRIGNLDFPVLLVALSYLLSAIMRTPNKMEALLLPGTATAIIAGALLYFLLNQLKKDEKQMAARVLFYSGTLFSALTILSAIGLFDKIPQLPIFVRSKVFNPAGGYLPSAILLSTLLPVGLGLFLNEKNTGRKMAVSISAVLIIVALSVSVFKMLPGKPLAPRFPDATTSWNIAVDSLKESPILGIGPGNFLTAFNRYRPISYNQTDLWALKFATGNDFYLTAFTEVGLLGMAGLILLALAVYRQLKKEYKERKLVGWGYTSYTNIVSLLILAVLLAFFPATAMLIALLFILLSFVANTRKTILNLSTQAPISAESVSQQAAQGVTSRLPSIIVTLPIIVVVVILGYRATTILSAEITYKKAIDALAQNQATETYDLMREAINKNPFVDRYHISYAQVNLAIANSLANNPELTDQDRATIAQLVQQAIREAKSTVALNPLRAGGWELLARIYQAIIPFAQGADAFSAQSYNQAVALDPLNPNVRISLGALYYARGNYNTSVRILELAVVSKPDLANAHYNLAIAYRENGQIDEAINQMTVVLSLVDRDSNDFETAKTVLEDLETRRAQATETPAGAELIPPQPAGEPVLEPPLELPEDAEPPETPVTPTPTPEAGEEEEGPFTLTPSPTP